VVVGWIGTPGTLNNLDLIAGALDEVAQRRPEMRMRLVGVGADRSKLPRFASQRVSVVDGYDQAAMVDEILGMDIGLFPLQDTERSRVRGVLKATVYMAGHAAVIASPIGQVPEVISDGENGFLARTSTEWISKLEALVADHALRHRIADAGLEMVRQRFRTDQSWDLLRDVLRP
jgi:glycosyltransferase involved in cell wall biosynthesis